MHLYLVCASMAPRNIWCGPTHGPYKYMLCVRAWPLEIERLYVHRILWTMVRIIYLCGPVCQQDREHSAHRHRVSLPETCSKLSAEEILEAVRKTLQTQHAVQKHRT